MAIHFTNPFWLLLLLAVVPALLGWRRYLHSPGVPLLLRSVLYLRGMALLCLVLALAGTQWMARRRAVDLIFALDVSESMTPAAQEQGLEFIRNVSRQLGKHDRAGLIVFGREAYMDQPLGARLTNLTAVEAAPARSETDLEAALQLALAHAEPDRNVRVVVVSDGLSTRGDVETLLPTFRSRGIPIDSFQLGAQPENEAAVEQVQAPARVGRDQPFSVRVVASATQDMPGQIRLFRNGALIADQAVQLQKGRNVFDFTGFKEESGANTFTVRLEAGADTLLQNNVGYATVTVEGPSRALVVTDDPGASAALIDALRRQGIEVDVTGTTALPANATALTSYGALVLHDVSALKLSLSQQQQIAAYVRDLGGGLVTVGGYNSYGLGGYYKSPLEEILPLTMDTPQTLVMPSLAMLLIIDKSGSMAGTQGNLTKISLAKEAALGVLDVMTDRDIFGVLAFEGAYHWVVPLQPAVARAHMAQQIATLAADGGTDLGPAMQEAARALEQVQAMVKHAVILSDGQSLEYDFQDVTAKLRRGGVTVSTVAIGGDADRQLLQQIAAWGNGRFYFTDDIRTIPQIFTTEAMVVTRPLAVEEPFQPVPRQPSAFLTGIDPARVPPLGGYVLTSPKATAAVHLETADGSPLLASWRHGLGRVVAFTSDATSNWAADWLKWSGFGSFWSQSVRWVMRPENTDALRTYFHIHEGRGTLVVDAVDAEGRFINFLPLQAEVLSPTGKAEMLTLAQTAPGQYQATFPAGEEGAWLAAVADPTGTRYQQPTLVGTVLPYAAEYRLTGLDSGALERLSQLTGGTLFRGPQPPAKSELRTLLRHPYPVRSAVPLWPLLLFLAFILFLTDIVLRYLPPGLAAAIDLSALSRLPWCRWLVKALTSEQPEGAGPLHLDELVQHRRMADLAVKPRYEFGALDPTKAAARYLARRRAHSQAEDGNEKAGDQGA